jgi:hypothetical protein
MSVHGVLWYLLLDYMGWWAPVCCAMSVHGVLWYRHVRTRAQNVRGAQVYESGDALTLSRA